MNNCTRIKMPERPKVELLGEPIAELTKLGWVILTPAKENASTNILLTKSPCMAMKTYVVYNHEKNKEFVYGEFRK